jgi:uncharacterized protein (TIGR03067 family)
MKRLVMTLLASGFLAFTLGHVVGGQQPQNTDQKAKDNLTGTWAAVAHNGFAQEVSRDELRSLRLTFKDNHIFASYGNKKAEANFKLNRIEAGPSQIDVAVTEGPEEVKGKSMQGIYLLEGDTLKVLYSDPGKARPNAFTDENKPGVYALSFKREK